MKNLILRLTKYDHPSDILELQNYCTSIKLSNSFSQIAAELNFEIPYATTSSSLLAINIEIADKIILLYKGKQIFSGKVIDLDLKGKAESLSVSCFDYCWWLCKSNITKNFNNISIIQALASVYGEVGAEWQIEAELGTNGNIMLNSHLVKDKPVPKVLQAIYSEVTKQTGVYYYMHQADNGMCVITEADKYYSGLTIQAPTSLKSADGNLIDYEISESMQNMVTRIALYNEDGSKALYGKDEDGDGVNIVMLDDTDLSRWGIIQDSMTMDSETDATKAREEAKQTLRAKSSPTEELSVTCIGDIDYKVAYGALVKIPNTNYYDKFMYILSSEWIWNKDETFISKLSLTPSKHHNLTDFSDIEEKQENTSSDNATGETKSDLVNRIITELKKHLGVPYKWAGKSPADGGMDCSGYIAYVYNQFSSELEITSGKLTSYTMSMMYEGKDVTKDFPDNLKEGDIIFPHAQHVVAYIGNGQIIEEPQTGDVCKIGPIRWDSVLKVIRVIPDSAWKTNSSVASNDAVSSNLIEFVKGYEYFQSPAKDDGYGTITIGYGETSKNRVAQGTCTKTEATQWVKEDLASAAEQVKNKLDSIGVNLPQNKFDVITDMVFNMGIGEDGCAGFFVKLTDGSSDSEVKNKLLNYNHASGEISPGLTKRCAARVKIWFDGVYDSSH